MPRVPVRVLEREDEAEGADVRDWGLVFLFIGNHFATIARHIGHGTSFITLGNSDVTKFNRYTIANFWGYFD